LNAKRLEAKAHYRGWVALTDRCYTSQHARSFWSGEQATPVGRRKEIDIRTSAERSFELHKIPRNTHVD